MSTEIRKPNMTPEKTPMPSLNPDDRMDNFKEVALGYTKEMAMEEATRCMNCPAQYCVRSCPLHNPIPEFIAKVREGDFEGAWNLLQENSPMPEICSRVCAQERQCECNCTRGIKSEPVGIGRLERFVADYHYFNVKEQDPVVLSNQKRVAVIGSGPAGLSCAWELRKEGFEVTVMEQEAFYGGVPVYGIPEFVLPNAMMDNLVKRLEKQGVVFQKQTKVTDADALLKQGYDAVFAGIGASKSIQAGIDGEGLNGVYSATEYLMKVNMEKSEELKHKKNVIVVGGGNTAIDAARSAKRMGAEHVYLVYRREKIDMPARKEEIAHAKEEGIEFKFLLSPVRINGENRVKELVCQQMEAGPYEYPGGRRIPVEVKDQQVKFAADLIIFALGYKVDPIKGLENTKKGAIKINDFYETSKENVYAGGDIVNGAATLVQAAADGKNAAKAIGKELNCH